MKKFLNKITTLTLILVFLLSLSACSSEDTTQYTFLDSSSAILEHIQDSMNQNQARCMFTVPSKDLIDSNAWLNSFAGMKNINCEYKKASKGYNVVITLSYWDNYPLVYAYENNDTSHLTEKQKELLERYKTVLKEIEDGMTPSGDDMTDTVNKILAIHDYMVTNMAYDTSIQDHFNAHTALIGGRAICSGYAEVFKTFMDFIGVENMAISGRGNDENHMWNLIKLDKWYHVDVTWDDPVGSTSSAIRHTYFNLDDSAISADHVWDTSAYPAADGSNYSYFNIKGIKTLNSQSELVLYITEVIKSRTTHCEILVYGESNLKEAFNVQSGVVLSYSYSQNKLSEYTIYNIDINY